MSSSIVVSVVTKTVTATSSSASASSTDRATPQGGIFEGSNPSHYDSKNPIILFIIQVRLWKARGEEPLSWNGGLYPSARKRRRSIRTYIPYLLYQMNRCVDAHGGIHLKSSTVFNMATGILLTYPKGRHHHHLLPTSPLPSLQAPTASSHC